VATPANQLPALDYASREAAPSEFELALQRYRGQWLRRRFLWFCAVGVLANVGFNALNLRGLFTAQGPARWALGVSTLQLTLSLAVTLSAFVYAWRSPPRVATILRLAVLLVVVDTVLAMLSARIELVFEAAAGDPTALTPPAFWAAVFPATIFFGHLIACLFVPWTVRESLKPVGINLAIYATCVIIDLWLLNKAPVPASLVAMILAAPLGAIPGTLVCLWRSWRFHRRFQLEFESSGYRRLQGELVSARRLHESSLPPQRPAGAIRLAYAYEPAQQIGGDMLFVHPPTPASEILTAVILDVTGHGVGSALMVNRLLGELERLFALSPDSRPGQVIAALNAYARLTMARHGVYVTALCVRTDRQTGELLWASGGHPPALLRRRDGRIDRLESTAMMLGVLDSTQFDPGEQRLPLAPGDVVLAYTDGAIESRNEQDRLFEIEGLCQALNDLGASANPSDTWPTAVLARIVRFRNVPPQDDTLVVSITTV
jgi:serine phosphatase RsbU (regulator of sigma subunit)